MSLLIPILTMGILGLLFASGLAVAYQKLKVVVDPKIEKVLEALPQANCGACGFSGCAAFAEAVAAGKAEANGCPVGGEETAHAVADILGQKAGSVIKKVARIHCRGSKAAALDRGKYEGIPSCGAANLVGGNKQCSYGCMGFGDCVDACLFDAIFISEDGLPVVSEEKCTACGKCVDACPRGIISLHPLADNMMVFCRSLDIGKTARKVCKSSCIACGICARACPDGIVMENNLAVIKDKSKIEFEQIPAIEKCPTKAIGRIHREPEAGAPSQEIEESA
ncbi:MAG: RnfABCDGE type electron transport complex subunit B [Candidatus Aminicenantes bacterium]|nr:RnfABCDGE type electron transport complex subunit B [Candidatus Aminicenantes bacterium]